MGLINRMFTGLPVKDNVKEVSSQSRRQRFRTIIWTKAPPTVRILLPLWIFVPVAIAIGFSLHNEHRIVFAFSFIAIIPCASTLDLAGQELSRMLPHVAGIAVETLLSTVVEMVLFITLIARPNAAGNSVTIIKAAILGSILANMLLCLGICLLLGGIKHKEQKIHEAVGGTSSGKIPKRVEYDLLNCIRRPPR